MTGYRITNARWAHKCRSFFDTDGGNVTPKIRYSKCTTDLGTAVGRAREAVQNATDPLEVGCNLCFHIVRVRVPWKEPPVMKSTCTPYSI